MRRPVRCRSRTCLALLTSLRKGSQRTKSRSLTPPKPRGFGMTEKDEEKAHRLKPVLPGGRAPSWLRVNWKPALPRTGRGSGTKKAPRLAAAPLQNHIWKRARVTCPFWGISCRPSWLSLPCKSPSVLQSFAAGACRASESQSCPLQLVYGCPRQVSRKFRAENQKMAAVVRKDSPGRHKGRCFLRSAPSCDDGRVGRACRQDAGATRITQLFGDSQQVPTADTSSHTI